MRNILLPILTAFAVLLAPSVAAEKSGSQPYIGQWSNGRGESLLITSTSLKFLRDKPVSYRAIPRATDDSSFKLQITSSGSVNYFQKFLWLTMRGKNEMIVESFDSLEQLASGDAGVQRWFRDK